jgi:hypothetical protein
MSIGRKFGKGNERGFSQLYQHASTHDAQRFIGKPGEITYDPCALELHIHNGCKPGGCLTLAATQSICAQMNAMDDMALSYPVPATTKMVVLDETDNSCNVANILNPPILTVQAQFFNLVGTQLQLDLNAVWAAFNLDACTGAALPMGSALARCSDLHPAADIFEGTGLDVVKNLATQDFTISLDPVEAIAAICSTATARNNLVACVRDAALGNNIVIGPNGGLFVGQPPIDINVQGLVYNPLNTTLTLTETDGTVHQVNLSNLLNPLQDIIAAEGDNLITAGANGGAYLTVCTISAAMVKALSNALGEGNDASPSLNLNYALRRDPVTCQMLVPYASEGNAGALEIIDSARAVQDHNLPDDNDLNVVGTMNNRPPMDDLRVLTADKAVDWFNNNFWIQANRTYNIPSARFPDVVSIMTYLRDHRIAPGVTVNIQLAAGVQASGGNIVGHPDGNQIVITGAPMVGLTPTVIEFPSTGATAALRLADYNAAVALFKPRYGTVLQGNVSVTTGLLPPRMTNIYLEGRVLINGAFADGSIASYFNNLFIDNDANNSIGLSLTNSRLGNSLNVFVIGTVNSNIQFNDSHMRFLNELVAAYASISNILSRSDSNINISCASCGFFGAGFDNISVYEAGKLFVNTGNATLKHATRNNAYASDDGTISLSGAGDAVIAQFAGVTNMRSAKGGKFVSRANGAVTSMLLDSAPIGIDVSGGGLWEYDNTLTTMTLSNHSAEGVRVDMGRAILPNTIFSGNTLDVLATGAAFIRLNGSVPGTSSPPVGVVGNFNSIIVT